MCIHYTREAGVERKDCAAGINARNLVGGSDVGWITRCPCFHSNNAGTEHPKCPSYEEPTRQIIDDERRQWDDHIAKVLPWAMALKQEHGPNSDGYTECPICTGPARFYIASNNHLHAACMKDGCAQFHQ